MRERYKKTKFQEVMGDKPLIKILEIFLEDGKVDLGMGTIKEFAKVSTGRLYEIVPELVEKGWVIKSRRIGNKQLYKLNYKNKCVKLLDRFFVSVITS